MDVMSVAASAMQHDLLKVESISQNLANVLTPGYKKQIVVGSTFPTQLNAGLAAASDVARPPSLAIDFTPGSLRFTGQATDVAIEGTEFFEVAGKDGPAYTRQGTFHADLRGRLVGAGGWPVMGASGEIVVSGPFTIGHNGDVRQGERVVGRLKTVKFANPEALVPLGSGLYGAGAATTAEQGVAPSLRVGFQENSNVSSPQEMVRLSETVRHFEALQKIIQGYDESLEKTIRKLGEF